MAKTFLTPIDLSKNEIRNSLIHVLGSAPSSPAEGQLYYNSTDKNVYIYDGTQWVDLTIQGSVPSYGSPASTIQAGDTVSGGSSTDVLRSDAQFAVETGAASTISGSNAEGTGTALARADHNHALGSGVVGTTQLAAGVRLDTVNAPTAAVSLNSQRITNLAAPSAANDAARKADVDAATAGLDTKGSVRAASTANVTLASAAENGDTIDGVTLATGDRILLKNQSAPAENGIYTVNASGAPTRSTDMDAWAEIPSAYTWVEEGTVNADTGWICTSNAGGTLNTTSITFTQFTGLGQITAGAGLTQTGNTMDIVGTSNRISVAADSIDISSSYVGQASITTLGTITTGTWNGTDISVADGGTGSSTASGARTNLSAAGYYSSATHSSGTTISISQATHGLRATRGLIIQIQEESSGDTIEADASVSSGGDVTITFAASQSANSKRVTLVG